MEYLIITLIKERLGYIENNTEEQIKKLLREIFKLEKQKNEIIKEYGKQDSKIAIQKTLDIEFKIIKLKEETVRLIPPIIYNDKIDIKNTFEFNTYSIYLHNLPVKIGEISYNGYHIESPSTDVTFIAESDYDLSDYVYDIFSLTKELLSEKKIPDFWIGILNWDEYGKEAMEKLGGVILDNNSNPNITLYECKTNNITKKKTI